MTTRSPPGSAAGPSSARSRCSNTSRMTWLHFVSGRHASAQVVTSCSLFRLARIGSTRGTSTSGTSAGYPLTNSEPCSALQVLRRSRCGTMAGPSATRWMPCGHKWPDEAAETRPTPTSSGPRRVAAHSQPGNKLVGLGVRTADLFAHSEGSNGWHPVMARAWSSWAARLPSPGCVAIGGPAARRGLPRRGADQLHRGPRSIPANLALCVLQGCLDQDRGWCGSGRR